MGHKLIRKRITIYSHSIQNKTFINSNLSGEISKLKFFEIVMYTFHAPKQVDNKSEIWKRNTFG